MVIKSKDLRFDYNNTLKVEDLTRKISIKLIEIIYNILR
jgi:hypothetical protein